VSTEINRIVRVEVQGPHLITAVRHEVIRRTVARLHEAELRVLLLQIVQPTGVQAPEREVVVLHKVPVQGAINLIAVLPHVVAPIAHRVVTIPALEVTGALEVALEVPVA